MNKTKSQLSVKVKRLFTGAEVGVLLEDIDQKMGYVIDGQKGLGRRMETLESSVNGLGKRVTRVEVKVDTLTETVGEMKVELTEVKEKLDRKADRSEVVKLNSRISLLETR